ncbi:hypothetical protein [Paraglaciecola aestuariivivens]
MNLTAIFIVGIVCWALVELIKTIKQNNQSEQENHSQSLESQINTLQERVATLEKIVTDEKYDLNRQFDDLKKDKVA